MRVYEITERTPERPAGSAVRVCLLAGMAAVGEGKVIRSRPEREKIPRSERSGGLFLTDPACP